jgi:hypothetical protein
MPSNSEKVDMLLILGESHGNYEAAIRLYARRYPNRRTPRNHVFRNLEISGGSSGVAEWAVPTQNQMTYFFLILFSFLNLSIIYLMICY